jgi:hypothetical protein
MHARRGGRTPIAVASPAWSRARVTVRDSRGRESARAHRLHVGTPGPVRLDGLCPPRQRCAQVTQAGGVDLLQPSMSGAISSLSGSARLESVNVEGIPAPRKRRRRGATAPKAEGRAALYLRVSTAEQADPGLNGGSLESQEARCRALSEARA